MIKNKRKGVALALVLIILVLVAVSGLILGSIGIINLIKVRNFEWSTTALYAAKAGVAQAMKELSCDSIWTTGFNNEPLTSVSGTYTITFDTSKPHYSTNNINGISNIIRADGITVQPGFCYIISTGTVKNVSKRIAAMIKASGGGINFNYALAAGSGITLRANTHITGNVKANGDINFNASATIVPYNGEGNVYSSANINLNATVTLDPAEYVKAANTISNPSKLRPIGFSNYVSGDTSNDTKPFICDGSLTPTTLPGRESLPNPDMTTLLAPGTYTSHSETEISGNFDLGGGIHYFPNGVNFVSGSSLQGEGTIVVGNGSTIEFYIPLGSTSNYFPVNIIAVDGHNGTIGGGNIVFKRNTCIHGLIYSHGNINSEANFRIKGTVISYKGGGVDVVYTESNAEFHLNTFAVPVPGFEPWFGTGKGSSGASSLEVTSWHLVY